MRDREGPVVNLYAPGSATITLPSGVRVEIEQQTDYPITGTIHLTVRPDRRRATFPLKLRIPAWSAQSRLTVNGKDAGIALLPGTYATVTRHWNAADVLELTLDMRGTVVRDPGGSDQIAVTRGQSFLPGITACRPRTLPMPTSSPTIHIASS